MEDTAKIIENLDQPNSAEILYGKRGMSDIKPEKVRFTHSTKLTSNRLKPLTNRKRNKTLSSLERHRNMLKVIFS